MKRASGALRASVVAAAGIAVCGVAANSAALALHEVFGHGLAAIASGGRFLSFFVSPTAAFAETATSDVGALWMNAAGTPVNVITGLLAYGALKRRRDLSALASLALWQFTHTSLVFQLLYVGGPPLGLWLAGQAPQGDWSVLFSRLGVHPLVAAVVFVPLSVIAAAKLARMSERLTPWPVAGWRRVGTVAAYLSLVLPPLMLIILYALVTLPWSTPRDHFEFGGMIVTPLSAGLAGAVVAQLRRSRADDRTAAASPGIVSPVTPKALAILIAVLCGVGWVFGPTTGLRRGIAVQQPTPDDYFRAAQDLRITVTFGNSGEARLLLSSQPVPARGSPHVRRLSERLAALGPSRDAAAEFTAFVAETNFGLTNTQVVEAPQRRDQNWHWSGTSTVESTQLTVRIWPATYTAHGRVVEVTLHGATPAPGAAAVEGLIAADGTTTWRRPPTFAAPIQFEVTTPR